MDNNVDLNYLIYSLSEALDLVGIDDLNHSKRVAYMVLEMTKEMNLAKEERIDCVRAALLHDCGVSSTLIHEELLQKVDYALANDHCVRGFNLLMKSEKLKKYATCVLFHHTRWKDLIYLEMPDKCKRCANLIFLCDRIDAIMYQFFNTSVYKDQHLLARSSVLEKLEEMRDDYFSNELIDFFITIAQKESFWFGFRDDILRDYFRDFLETTVLEKLATTQIKEIALLFAYFVDAKSHFTADHSIYVAKVAYHLALISGLDEEVAIKLEIAGLLHDIGKLIIPDEILEKSGSLTTDEFNIIKSHVYEAEQILKNIKGLKKITSWAASHHEKLNGVGYPYNKQDNIISLPMRILAISDIFQALVQERPYRDSLPLDEVLSILREMSIKQEIDSEVFNTLEANGEYFYAIAKGRE